MNEPSLFILSHLWESSLFGIACTLLILALGKSWSYNRHLLAWASILKFLIPLAVFTPLLVFSKGIFTADNSPVAPVTPYLDLTSDALQIETWITPTDLDTPASDELFWATGLASLWAIGFLFLTFFWIRQYRLTSASISNGCLEATDSWRILAESVWEKSLHRMPRILICRDENLLAGVFGFRKPTVVIPASFEVDFDQSECEAFLRHEFQHVYKHDTLWLFVQKLIRNLFWFHPLVWWLDRQISAEREILRDEEVIRKTENVTSYLNCLMKASNIKLPRSYATSVGIKGSPFAKRVKAIARIKSSRLGDILSAAGSITAVLALTFFLSASLSLSHLNAAEDHDEESDHNEREIAMKDHRAEIRELEIELETKTKELNQAAQEIERGLKKEKQVLKHYQLERMSQVISEIAQKIKEKTLFFHDTEREGPQHIERRIGELQNRLEQGRFESDQGAEQARREIAQLRRQLDAYSDLRSNLKPKLNEREQQVIHDIDNALQSGDKEAALDMADEAITEETSAVFVYYAANLLSELGQTEKAVDFYKVALDKSPNFRQAAKNLGVHQIRLKRYKNAKTNLLLARRLGEESSGIDGLLALCYLKTGDPATAEHHYRIAIRNQPETEDWRRGLALSLQKQGKNEEANEFRRSLADNDEPRF